MNNKEIMECLQDQLGKPIENRKKAIMRFWNAVDRMNLNVR